MKPFNYYLAPTNEVFNEIKAKAIKLWQTYSDEYCYATEKINRIQDIENFQDNAWYIVGMFDPLNQFKLIKILDEPAKSEVQTMLEWSYKEAKELDII
jgi:ribosome maturation protein Sdo1